MTRSNVIQELLTIWTAQNIYQHWLGELFFFGGALRRRRTCCLNVSKDQRTEQLHKHLDTLLECDRMCWVINEDARHVSSVWNMEMELKNIEISEAAALNGVVNNLLRFLLKALNTIF